jgi:hypothetical protein
MAGSIDLVDGLWVLKDSSGNEFALGPSLPPEALYPDRFPAEPGTTALYEAILREGRPDASLSYAEPGMAGSIDLVDGLWILKDSSGNEFALGPSLPPEALYPNAFPAEPGTTGLYDAILRDGRRYLSLAYTELGISGTIDLIDGRWVLRDSADVEYILLHPDEMTALGLYEPRSAGEGAAADTPLAYAEPGMGGTIHLIDGRWVLRLDAIDGEFPEAEYLLPPPNEMTALGLYEPRSAGEGAAADTSLAYAEPGMNGSVDLIDGRWILRDSNYVEYLIALPEEIMALKLYEPRIEQNWPDASLSYAEPGMGGTVHLIDGRWILRDFDYVEYLIALPEEIETLKLYEIRPKQNDPEVSLAYAEPGMTGSVHLIDGNWILRAADDMEYLILLPQEIESLRLYDLSGGEEHPDVSLTYAEPGMNGTVYLVDGRWVLRDSADVEYLITIPSEDDILALYDPRFRERYPDVSQSYAEPGMNGTVYLVDGRWVLRDSADVEYLITIPREDDILAMYDPRFREGYPDVSQSYAEPGMNGTVYLVDGRWVLRDSADVEYLITIPSEDDILALHASRFRERYPDVSLTYAKPGMSGTVYLVDGRWVLRDSVDVEYLITIPSEWGLVRMYEETRYRKNAAMKAASAYREESTLLAILTQKLTVDGAETVDYPGGHIFDYIWEFDVDLPQNEAMAKNIYDTIVSIESAADRPPEVIMDLGPVSRNKSGVIPPNASLRLIKRLSTGKYYLQIGLFDRKEVLARKLTSLNWDYPYSLETYGDLQRPKYKLLVGPLNEGESNALLLRFKRYGYPDAFIRRDG